MHLDCRNGKVSSMYRILGISFGLIGMTVASGMGLSLVHDSFFSDPIPVRAQVIQPAQTETMVVIAPRIVETPAVAKPARVARLGNDTQPAIGDVDNPAPDVLVGRATVSDGNVAISLRPRLRALETRQARVEPRPLPKKVANFLPRPSLPQAAQQRRSPVSLPAPQPRVVIRPAAPQPTVRTASRTLPPKTLIGVFR